MQTDKEVILLVRSLNPIEITDRFPPQLRTVDLEGFYSSLLEDMIERLNSLSHIHLLVVCDPEAQAHFSSSRTPGKFELVSTGGSNLTTKLEPSVGTLFGGRFRRLVWLRVDNPLLDLSFIEHTFMLLATDDDAIVLGPTESGRCSLLGTKSPLPDLVDRFIEKEEDFDEVLKRVCSLDVFVYTLPAMFTVDRWDDLFRLRAEIERAQQEKRPFPRRTYERLKQLERKYRPSKLAS